MKQNSFKSIHFKSNGFKLFYFKLNYLKLFHFKLFYFKSNDYIYGVKLMICAMESPFVYGKMAESGTCQHHRPDEAAIQQLARFADAQANQFFQNITI